MPETPVTSELRRLPLDDEALRAIDFCRFNFGRNPYGKGDSSIVDPYRNGIAWFRDYVERRTGFTGGAMVLDLLCGWGRWLPFLAEQNDHVIGLERLGGCVRIARGMSREFGFDNVELLKGDIATIETFADGTFDYIWMYSALQYVERGYALRQIARVLRPGGRVYVGQYNSTGLMLEHFWKGVESGTINQGASQWALGALVHGPAGDGNPNYANLEDSGELCARFGLECVSAAPAGRLDVSGTTSDEDAKPPRLVFEHYHPTIEFVAAKPGDSTSAPVSRRAPHRVRVLVILSIAYSGTTWFTLVAGSHREILCLGAGDRLLDAYAKGEAVHCMVHGRSCDFWQRFFETADRSDNFFAQLAEYSGKRTFVINNPSIDAIEKHMRDPRVDLRVLTYVRDGRASLASAMRHHPDRVDSVYQAALAWLYRGTLSLQRRLKRLDVTDAPYLRYEDAVTDPDRALAELGRLTGLDYDRASLRYWEFEHHLVTGNVGAIDTLVRLQGGKGYTTKNPAYYDELVERLEATDGVPALDESWREAYGPVDLAAWDFAAGELYARFGYAREDVPAPVQAEFRERYDPPSTAEEAAKAFGPWRRESAIEAGVQGIVARVLEGLGRLRRALRIP